MAKRRLSGQQKRRIHDLQQARLARVAEKADRRAEKLAEAGLGPEQSGRVQVNFGNAVVVEAEDGALVRCHARQNLGPIACGDRVAWQASKEGDGVITAVAPRSSSLERPDVHGNLRPIAVNLDRLVVVVATRPDFSEAMIDRYLVAAELAGIPAALLLNKTDLLDDAGLASATARLADYARIGYPVWQASCKREHGLDALREALAESSSLLVGQSGVGKSSLVNALLPDREVRTGALSSTGGRGMHTTTATTLYHLPGGGDLIDSPGVWEFAPPLGEPEDVAHGFVEFRPLLGHCRFSDCRHQVEPGCAIVEGVEKGLITPKRLESFRTLYASLTS
jgi:ribosome biogenesis GTPase